MREMMRRFGDRLVAAGLMAFVLAGAGFYVHAAVVGRYDGTLEGPVYEETGTGESLQVLAPVFFYAEFDGKALDTTIDWNVDGVNSGAGAIAAGAGGLCRLTTGIADDDDVELSTPLIWYANRGCSAEARFAINDADGSAWTFGFADAVQYSADEIAVIYNTAPLSAATDWAGFFWDPDASIDVVRVLGVKATVKSDVLATSTVCADGVMHVYRVDCSSAGDLEFFVDGSSVGGLSAAVTVTAPLAIYVGVINREGAANTLDVDYVRGWELRN